MLSEDSLQTSKVHRLQHFANWLENIFQKKHQKQDTCEHTLEKNFIVARSVEKDFPRPSTWEHTCEHTVEKNLIVARSVEKDFPIQEP